MQQSKQQFGYGNQRQMPDLNQDPGENLADFIKVLEDHRHTCEIEGKYVEAEMAKNRIEELKVQEYEREYAEMLHRHAQQSEECERAHIKQYQDFNQQWDDDLLQVQQEDQQALAELEDRHTKEIDRNRDILEDKLPHTFKYSADLLNKQKIQSNLAK